MEQPITFDKTLTPINNTNEHVLTIKDPRKPIARQLGAYALAPSNHTIRHEHDKAAPPSTWVEESNVVGPWSSPTSSGSMLPKRIGLTREFGSSWSEWVVPTLQRLVIKSALIEDASPKPSFACLLSRIA